LPANNPCFAAPSSRSFPFENFQFFLRLLEPFENPPFLLLLRDVEEELRDDDPVPREVALEVQMS